MARSLLYLFTSCESFSLHLEIPYRHYRGNSVGFLPWPLNHLSWLR